MVGYQKAYLNQISYLFIFLLMFGIAFPSHTLGTEAGKSQECGDVLASASDRVEAIRKVVAKKKLSLKQRLILKFKKKSVEYFLREEVARLGLDLATCSNEALENAIASAYERAWDSLKTSSRRILNGMGLTTLGAGIFYLCNKLLGSVLPPGQAEAGAFALGLVGAPLVQAISASLIEIVHAKLKRRSYRMTGFDTEVAKSAQGRLQEIHFYANATLMATQQGGRSIDTNLDLTFTSKIRWAVESLLKYLEGGTELRKQKAVEAVAMALIKLREGWPDMLEALLAKKDVTLVREPRRLFRGIFDQDEKLTLDAFYNDVRKVIEQEDPHAGNDVVLKALLTVLDQILKPGSESEPTESKS